MNDKDIRNASLGSLLFIQYVNVIAMNKITVFKNILKNG